MNNFIIMCYTLTPGEYPEEEPKNTENEFIGNGWSVEKKEDKYLFTYISGSMSGKLNTINITKEDFNLIKENKITFDELCIKYNVN